MSSLVVVLTPNSRSVFRAGVSLNIRLFIHSFAVNDCLDAKRHAGYQRFAVLLGDFSDSNFLDGLPQVLDWTEIWTVPGPFQHRGLVFLQEFSGCL